MSNLAFKKDEKLNLTVCILAKNDENFIEDCIRVFHGKVREILVVDYGSTDNTVNLARNFTNRIYWYKWNNDYSAARNTCLKYASSDWVLCIDAYEKISAEDFSKITSKTLDKNNKVLSYISKVIERYDDGDLETYSCRLFRRMNGIKFKLTMAESASEDIQRLAKRNRLEIVSHDMTIVKQISKKYTDERSLFEEQVELAKKGLEDPKSSDFLKTYYKLSLGLSLNSLDEHDTADEIIAEVLEEIRTYEKRTVYNIPHFIQAFLFTAFNHAKYKKYVEGLEVIQEGVDIYPNSLNMLLRYGEFLYANERYRDTINCLIKMKDLIEEKNYYMMERIDFEKIERIAAKLEKVAHEKYKLQQESA